MAAPERDRCRIAAQFQGRPAEPGVDGWKVAPFFFLATVKGIQHDSINKSWDILYLFYFGYTCIFVEWNLFLPEFAPSLRKASPVKGVFKMMASRAWGKCHGASFLGRGGCPFCCSVLFAAFWVSLPSLWTWIQMVGSVCICVTVLVAHRSSQTMVHLWSNMWFLGSETTLWYKNTGSSYFLWQTRRPFFSGLITVIRSYPAVSFTAMAGDSFVPERGAMTAGNSRRTKVDLST